MVAYLRKPGVLMTAYVALFVRSGPWHGLHGPSGYVVHPDATRNLPQIVRAAFLAWRVTRGRRISLALIMIFSAAGCALAIGAIAGGIAGLLPGGVPEVLDAMTYDAFTGRHDNLAWKRRADAGARLTLAGNGRPAAATHDLPERSHRPASR